MSIYKETVKDVQFKIHIQLPKLIAHNAFVLISQWNLFLVLEDAGVQMEVFIEMANASLALALEEMVL